MATTVQHGRKLASLLEESAGKIEFSTEIIHPIHSDFSNGMLRVNYNEKYTRKLIADADLLFEVADKYGQGQVKGISVIAPKPYDWPGSNLPESRKILLDDVKVGLAKLIVRQSIRKVYSVETIGDFVLQNLPERSNPMELKSILWATTMAEAGFIPVEELKNAAQALLICQRGMAIQDLTGLNLGF